MPEIITIKPSFAGGEYAPSLQSRVDLQMYASGAKKLKNFFCHPHGGISNRAGFIYKATGKTSGKEIRLIPFEFSTEQTYMIEFGEYYCRFFTDGGQIQKYTTWATSTAYIVGDYVKQGTTYYYCCTAHTSGVFADDLTAVKWKATSWVTSHGYVRGDYVTHTGVIYYCEIAHTSGTFADDVTAGKFVIRTTYEIATPYSEDDLVSINYTQSADVLYLAHPDHAPQELARIGNSLWTLTAYDYTGGPFQVQNVNTSFKVKISATSGTGKTLTATGFTFDYQGHVGALWKLRHYIEGQAVTIALDSVENSGSISCGGTWRLITHGTWTGTIRVQKSTDGGTTWTMLREFSSADDFNPETYGTEDIGDDDPFLVRVIMTAWTSGACNANLTTDPFYQEGIVKITAVAVGGATATADVKKACGLTTDTIDWAEGSWSPYAGWPAVVEFHPEDRLGFANTYTEPQTYWFTRTGNYIDFSRSSPLLDSDGISSPLPSRKVNGINGLVPLTEMIALTSSSEASIRSSAGPLTPLTTYNRIQGYEGSFGTRPIVIGNRVIYVQATGSIIRDIGYAIQSDGFEGDDISVRSNHLFTGYTIKDMAYQQNPDRIVWVVRSDGILLSMTYMREQQVIAWTWHDANISGALEWVTAHAYVAGNWVIKSGVTYYCNTGHTAGVFATDLAAGKWTATDIRARFESVACIRGDGYDEVWVSIKRGNNRYIEKLDNRMYSTSPEDQIFLDSCITATSPGSVTITGLGHLEGKTVNCLADGNVILGKVVASGQIALDVIYDLVHIGIPYVSDLETLNIEVNLQSGTSQGRQIKVSMLVLKLLNSRGGYLGPDEDTLFPLHNEGRETWDDPLELYSGDQPETLGGGYSDGGRIFFRQTDPLPVTILAIVPSLQVGGMTQT